jgi:hypothetical protein
MIMAKSSQVMNKSINPSIVKVTLPSHIIVFLINDPYIFLKTSPPMHLKIYYFLMLPAKACFFPDAVNNVAQWSGL